MKWQNLIKAKCPRCDGALTPAMDHAPIYECQDDFDTGCHFVISEARYLRMLADPNHPMRLFADPEDLEKLTSLNTKEDNAE